MTLTNSPADRLEGITLSSGWLVGKRIASKDNATGSTFGVCYSASKDGKKGFVKALDFRGAFGAPNFLQAISALAKWIIWEKSVMEHCNACGLSRIVRLLDHEDFLLPEDYGDDTKKVACLVMEEGDGDLRAHFDKHLPDSWKLYVMRDVALGLDQLHRRGIAHLDVKPSNIIAIANPTERAIMKVGDLGRVVRKGVSGPFDNDLWPGDPKYQPPEKWYGVISRQWNNEREAADAFLLGSLLVFLYCGIPMSTLLHDLLPEPFKPAHYRGDFDADLLDVLINSQAKAITNQIKPMFPARHQQELLEITAELTFPDPTKRGDRKARRQGIVGIDRYHQRFLRMALSMENAERSIRK